MAYQFKQAAETLSVIFRKFKDGDDIIALFPTEPVDIHPGNCMSYMHVGQHGGATLSLVKEKTVPATEEEYKDLLQELKGIYEPDEKLVVRTKVTPAMDQLRLNALEVYRQGSKKQAAEDDILEKCEKLAAGFGEEGMGKVADTYEGATEVKVDLNETKSRDGFIPYTSGGVQVSFTTQIDGLDTGWIKDLPEKAQGKMQKLIEDSFENIYKDFIREHKEYEETKDYWDLVNTLDKDPEASDLVEKLDEDTMDWFSEEGIMFYFQCFLYQPGDHGHPYKKDLEEFEGKSGDYGCYITTGLNWEAPYFRIGKFKDFEFYGPTHEFTFKTVEEFEKQLKEFGSEAIKAIL